MLTTAGASVAGAFDAAETDAVAFAATAAAAAAAVGVGAVVAADAGADVSERDSVKKGTRSSTVINIAQKAKPMRACSCWMTATS